VLIFKLSLSFFKITQIITYNMLIRYKIILVYQTKKKIYGTYILKSVIYTNINKLNISKTAAKKKLNKCA
jgi:hypothetical protein